MITSLVWITLLLATVAAFMAWLNARQLVSLVMPDRLRIDLGSGRVVAVGQDFARRFGYDSARSCQRQFLSQAHFKNTSLYQMVADLKTSLLVLFKRNAAKRLLVVCR